MAGVATRLPLNMEALGLTGIFPYPPVVLIGPHNMIDSMKKYTTCENLKNLSGRFVGGLNVE
jgi:hypothetical protein